MLGSLIKVLDMVIGCCSTRDLTNCERSFDGMSTMGHIPIWSDVSVFLAQKDNAFAITVVPDF